MHGRVPSLDHSTRPAPNNTEQAALGGGGAKAKPTPTVTPAAFFVGSIYDLDTDRSMRCVGRCGGREGGRA